MKSLDKIVKNLALGGLAATLIACGGGGNPPALASEADGRAQIRTKLVADMNASLIAGFTEDPDVEVNGSPVLADFEVERNDGYIPPYAYVEYTSPTDSSQSAQTEIQALYDAGIDYLYTGPSGAQAVGTAVQNYSNEGYAGFIPTP